MKKAMFIGNIILTAALMLTACDKDPKTNPGNGDNPATPIPKDREDIVLTKTQQQIGYNANAFTFDFLRAASAKEDAGKNLFLSPFSIQMALAMTAAGADGDTQTEMYDALRFGGFSGEEVGGFYHTIIPALQDVDNTTTFEIANSFWSKSFIPVKDTYKQDIEGNFSAEVRTLPDDSKAATSQVNGWCSEKTHGMIQKIVDEVSESTVVALMNALYFKGMWSDPFDKELSREDKFTNWDGSSKKTQFMNKSFENARVYSDEYVEAMSVPYGNKAFAMTIVVPRDGSSPEKVLAGLDAEKWAMYRDGGSFYHTEFSMPRFEEEYSAEQLCIDILQDMGMKLAFTNAANFSAMSTAPMCIDEIRHKAKIKVDEEGTEAAAVTYIGMRLTSVGPGGKTFYFKADRPFLYFISEQSTGAILFAGIKQAF